MPLKSRPTTTRKAAVHGSPCSVGQLYRSNIADAEEIDELDSVLFREGNNAREVLEEFNSAGYTVAHQTINKHRGGHCRCFRIDRDLWCLECYRDHAHCACDAT